MSWGHERTVGTFAEYREVNVTNPLRQGDVIEAVDPSASMWQRHLLVITADCDLAQEKHHGRVTCVPLLRAEEYLLEMQLPRIREKLLRKIVPVLRQLLTSNGAPNVSEERLRAWPGEQAPADIVTDLGLTGRDAETAGAALESIRLLQQSAKTLAEALGFLVEANAAAPNSQKPENFRKALVNQVQAPYSDPPGDALFLSAVAPGHDGGYFVYLRHLQQVWQSEIALGPSRRDFTYRRVAKMQDRYIHAMVQRFALVFMSIGLPREYEEMRDLHAELLGETYT